MPDQIIIPGQIAKPEQPKLELKILRDGPNVIVQCSFPFVLDPDAAAAFAAGIAEAARQGKQVQIAVQASMQPNGASHGG
jgi:hypothetical protein